MFLITFSVVVTSVSIALQCMDQSLSVFTMNSSSSGLWAFWKSSGISLQGHWDHLLLATGANIDDTNLWLHGTAIITTTTFWLVGGLYLFMDTTGLPKFMRKYKVQPGANEPVAPKRLKSALAVILTNQLLVGFVVLLTFVKLLKWRGHQDTKQLPEFHRVICEVLACVLINETLFYYSHRLLHWGRLYRWIHKKHHEWSAPLAITAIYCHPLEHAFSNLVPVLTGLFLFGSHMVTAWIWFTVATLVTLNDHSGYHLPFLVSPEAHDFHHFKFTNNFGVIGLLDWLHSTDDLFRKTPAGARHRMFFSFRAPREIVPDEKKGK